MRNWKHKDAFSKTTALQIVSNKYKPRTKPIAYNPDARYNHKGEIIKIDKLQPTYEKRADGWRRG